MGKYKHKFIIVERFFMHILFVLGVFVFLLLCVRIFIISSGFVDGPSMEPQFHDNDRFLVNKVSYYVSAPERHDVVQILDKTQKKLVLKRIIGLPGETVQIKRGHVYISEQGQEYASEIMEPYLPEHVFTKVKNQEGVFELTLGEEEYFLMGDNRKVSVDSRVYGAIKRRQIIGRVHH